VFLEKLRSLAGKHYDILRVYSFVGRLGLRKSLGFNLAMSPQKNENLHICTDAIMSRLIQSSAAFQKAANKRINFDHTDLKSWSINDVEKFHRFFPNLLPVVPLPLLSPLKPRSFSSSFPQEPDSRLLNPLTSIAVGLSNSAPSVPLWAYLHRFQRRVLLVWDRVLRQSEIISFKSDSNTKKKSFRYLWSIIASSTGFYQWLTTITYTLSTSRF